MALVGATTLFSDAEVTPFFLQIGEKPAIIHSIGSGLLPDQT